MSGSSENRWRWLRRRCSSAFVVGGLSIVVGVIFVLLAATVVSDILWLLTILFILAGVIAVLAGFAAIAVGLFGLFPLFDDTAPRFALAGVVSAATGAVAALVLLASVVIGIVVEELLGATMPDILTFIRVVLQTFYAGIGLSFLFFGAASRRNSSTSPVVGWALLLAGLLLFLAFAVNLLEWVFAVSRPPIWIDLLTYTLVPVLALVVGYSLRRRPEIP